MYEKTNMNKKIYWRNQTLIYRDFDFRYTVGKKEQQWYKNNPYIQVVQSIFGL